MNNDKKQIRPYILELFCFLFITGAMLYGCISGLIFRYVMLLFCSIFVVGAWLIHYVSSFVVFSIQAWIDLMRKDYCREKGLFREQYVFHTTAFLDKMIYEKMKKGREENMGQTLYFKIIVKIKGKKKVLTSSRYFELEEYHRYEFVYGRRSGALIDVIALEENV
ncbi:hypothetical protein [Flavonifractor hominis]|uniref:Uncharacterized protein n=1 Tax=Flavonifractor hominis TaxID=3133178 RepID=A0ABV1EKV1_9FIRM